MFCCPARIRTWIDRSPFAKACVGRLGFEPRINSSKGCCPTVRRPPRVNFGVGRAGKVCCPHLFGGSPMRRLPLDDRARKSIKYQVLCILYKKIKTRNRIRNSYLHYLRLKGGVILSHLLGGNRAKG